MGQLRVGMIGYEFMGRAHSNAWRQVSHYFRDLTVEPVMKVVCGRTESKVKEAKEALGWQEHSTRWEDVIARPDIDVIDICTPGYSHVTIGLAAAQAGIFVDVPSRVQSVRMHDDKRLFGQWIRKLLKSRRVISGSAVMRNHHI